MNAAHQLTRRELLRQAAAGMAGLASANLLARSASGAEGCPFQVGIYTRPWDQFEYRVALDAIAEAGFKHAGLMTSNSKNRLVISGEDTVEQAQKVGEEVKKRGLSIPSVYAGRIPVNKSLEAGIAGMRKIVDNCAAAGAKSILMGGMSNEKFVKDYYKAIAECCDYAAEKGIFITVKPHGGLNATGAQCSKQVKSVGHKNFGVWYDPGNVMYYSGGELDPIKDVAAVDGQVMGMCIKDFKLPKDVWLTPGTGLVDFPALMVRLKKGGFTKGPLVIETLARSKPPTLPELLAEAKKARKFVEGLVG